MAEFIDKRSHTLDVLSRSQQEKFPYDIDCAGMRITVFENVFSPKYFADSELAVCALKSALDLNGRTFLEIGAGTGIVSVCMAQAGAHCTATDINENALKNIMHNAAQNGVDVSVLYSDIFQNLPGKKFDIIFWNIPFTFADTDFLKNAPVDEMLALSCFSPEFKNYYEFLKNGFDYLNHGGRLLMGYSHAFAGSDLLDTIVHKLNLSKKVLVELPYDFDGDVQPFCLLEFRKL